MGDSLSIKISLYYYMVCPLRQLMVEADWEVWF